MNTLAVIAALVLPWIAGALALKALFPSPRAGHWAFCAGYGYVLGILAASALLSLQSMFGLRLGVTSPLLVFVVLIAVVWLRADRSALLQRPRLDDSAPRWAVIAFWVLATWLLLRLASLSYELVDRGLYSFDAFSTWIYRARVWVESGRIVPFVFPEVWLADPALDAGALPAAHYPATVSLIAAWPALAYGQWNETVALVPWLLLFVAMGLALFGQSRLWGASRLEAIVFVWFLLSMPLLAGQIALAGYADIWLAATLGFAFMSFMAWMRSGDARHGLLALALVAAGVFIKAESLVWAAFFVPALLTRWLGTRGWLALFAGAGAVILAVGLSGGIAWDLPLIGRLELSLDRVYTPMTGAFEFIAQQDVLRPLLVHFFVFDTWHLLLLAVFVALVLQIVQAADSRRTLEPWQRAALAWVLSAVAGFYLLFFWTPAAEWVRLGTSVNRILLHFAPALVFWLQCLWVMRREPQTGAR